MCLQPPIVHTDLAKIVLLDTMRLFQKSLNFRLSSVAQTQHSENRKNSATDHLLAMLTIGYSMQAWNSMTISSSNHLSASESVAAVLSHPPLMMLPYFVVNPIPHGAFYLMTTFC